MKRTGNKNLKIMAATMMTIFSLASVFMGTFAWFISIRRVNNEADSFTTGETGSSVIEISFHEYYGESIPASESDPTYFGFDPTPYSVLSLNEDTGQLEYKKNNMGVVNNAIRLGTYTLEYPHHPILMLFKVKGGEERIVAKTKYPFLAEDKPGNDPLSASNIVASYSALAAKAAGASDGEIFEVTNDENQQGRYEQYNVETEEYDVLPSKTRYAYNASTGGFDLVWVDLSMENNPLSSVIETHWFGFSWDEENYPYIKQNSDYVINNSSTALVSKTYNEIDDETGAVTPQGATKGLWIGTSEFTDDNKAGFVSIDEGGDDFEYAQTMEMFYGSTNTYSHVGVVVDYNSDAVEYISSYYLGHTYLNEGLTFLCDWVTEI